jgi:hypothetical protein
VIMLPLGLLKQRHQIIIQQQLFGVNTTDDLWFINSDWPGLLRRNANVVMVIQGTGNVGIGTTTPQYKLHVSGGKIRVDNFADF